MAHELTTERIRIAFEIYRLRKYCTMENRIFIDLKYRLQLDLSIGMSYYTYIHRQSTWFWQCSLTLTAFGYPEQKSKYFPLMPFYQNEVSICSLPFWTQLWFCRKKQYMYHGLKTSKVFGFAWCEGIEAMALIIICLLTVYCISTSSWAATILLSRGAKWFAESK